MGSDNANVTANVLGTIGTVLWCIQLSPQIYTNWKRKDTEGLPPLFMFLWCLSGVPFAIYFMMKDSYVPMQVQPQLFSVLCFVAWIQTMYYPPNPVKIRTIWICGGSFFLFALACELGFILWLKPVYANGTHWPALIFGVIASIILAAGLLPPYFELAKRKGRVVGINFVFLTMDSSGAIFSMASVLVDTIDLMGMILYAIVIAMELGIFLSHFIWFLRFRFRKGVVSDDEEAGEAMDAVSTHSGEVMAQLSDPNEKDKNIRDISSSRASQESGDKEIELRSASSADGNNDNDNKNNINSQLLPISSAAQ